MKTLFVLLLLTLSSVAQTTTEDNIHNSLLVLKDLNDIKNQKRICLILKKENLVKIHKISKQPNYIGNAYQKMLVDIWMNAMKNDIDLILKTKKD
jgi:hypothetical protein